MFRASVLAVFVFLCCLSVSFAETYDVCVIGGGASGSASAVFLHQRGYSVKVIEQNNTLGGHCNTFKFTADGEQLWLDIGVEGYTNSTFDNLNGLGTWALDSAAFVAQFVPAQLIASFGTTPATSSVSVAADFKTGTVLSGSANATAIGIALETLLGIVLQYPWLNTGERPDPVPAFMLEPFSDFITQYNLQPLTDNIMNALVFGSGYGSLSEMSTLQGLNGLSGINLQFILGTRYCAFSIIGGCQVLYDSIATYLGNSVTYNATITQVNRSKITSGGHAVISGYHINGAGVASSFKYNCGKVVVAVYPLLQNLFPWFDLTAAEVSLFSNMVAQGYLAMATTFTDGSLIAGQPFGLTNLDPTNTYALPSLPDLNGFMRNFPIGPAAAWVNSQSSYTPAWQMLDTAWDQIAGIPSSIMTNVQIAAWSLHQYGPHWTTTSQGQSPSPDTRLTNLQGQTGTYWVGSGVVSEGSTVVWNHAYKLILQNFPVKSR